MDKKVRGETDMMDTGPRVPRSNSRPESNRRRSGEAQPEAAPASPPVAPNRSATPKPKTAKSPRRWLLPLTATAVAIVVIVAGWWIWSNRQPASAAIDEDKYQAVSITDGQVYFGKMTMLSDDYVKLSSAYYLQSELDISEQPADGEETNVKLTTLGSKIYGPENQIIIAKDQIVSYENLQPDGQVAQWLDQNDG